MIIFHLSDVLTLRCFYSDKINHQAMDKKDVLTPKMQLIFGKYKNNIYKKQKIKHIVTIPMKMLEESRFLF